MSAQQARGPLKEGDEAKRSLTGTLPNISLNRILTMSRPRKPSTNPSPGKSWIRRRGEWVQVDNQILRWRKENAKRANKEAVDALFCGREIAQDAEDDSEDIVKVFV